MAFLSNLHTHTTHSDGTGSCEEYVRAAIAKGFVSIGFSDHAPTAFDLSYCMQRESIPAYLQEIRALRQKYAGQIEVYAGLESDWGEPVADRSGLDYVIGSVHYVRDAKTGEYHTIDYLHEQFAHAVESLGIRPMIQMYYDDVARTAEEYKPDILGHIDLICKLNADNRYFDPESAWYRELSLAAAERIAKTGVIVEVNTGAISRRYKTEPYPAPFLLRALCRQGVPVTLSSDCHSVDALDCAFDTSLKLLADCGYRTIKQMQGGCFVDVPLE